MKNTIQNKRYSWSSRMSEYDILQDKYAIKEDSWKKLSERLDQKPNKKKQHSWYWIAAAMIIVLLAVMPVLTRNMHKARQVGAFNHSDIVSAVKKENDVVDKSVTNTASAKEIQNAAKIDKKAYPKNNNAIAAVKKDTVLLQQENSSAVTDTQLLKQDIALEPAALPTVHINDITSKEPIQQNTSVRGLTVKKMIRLFSTDITKEQPSKNQQKMPERPNTIPDNQN